MTDAEVEKVANILATHAPTFIVEYPDKRYSVDFRSIAKWHLEQVKELTQERDNYKATKERYQTRLGEMTKLDVDERMKQADSFLAGIAMKQTSRIVELEMYVKKLEAVVEAGKLLYEELMAVMANMKIEVNPITRPPTPTKAVTAWHQALSALDEEEK